MSHSKLGRLLLSVATFGGSLHSELKSMKEQRDNLHDALHNAADEEIKNQADLRGMINETKKAKKEYDSKAPRLVSVDYYDFNDLEYLRGVSDVYNSKYFRFFMYNLQQDIMDGLASSDTDKAIELQGTAKGLAFLNRMLSTNEESLRAVIAPEKSQDDLYV